MEKLLNKNLLQIFIFSLFFFVELCNFNVVLASKTIQSKSFVDVFEKAFINRNNKLFAHYALKIRDTLKTNNDVNTLNTLIETIPDNNLVFYRYIINKQQVCNRYAFNIYFKCSDTILIKDKLWNQKDFKAILLAYNEHCRMIKNINQGSDNKLGFYFVLHFNTIKIDVFSPIMWKKLFDALYLIRQLRDDYNDSISVQLFQKHFSNLKFNQKMEVVGKNIFFELIKFYTF